MRISSRFVRLTGVAVVALAAACGGGDSGTTSPPTHTTPSTPVVPSTPSSPVVTTSVSVDDNVFNPSNIQVSPGQTVTWTWVTSTVHNVTFSDGGSGNKGGSNVTFTKTFPTAGTFSYSCTLHGGMNGSVLVK